MPAATDRPWTIRVALATAPVVIGAVTTGPVAARGFVGPDASWLVGHISTRLLSTPQVAHEFVEEVTHRTQCAA